MQPRHPASTTAYSSSCSMSQQRSIERGLLAGETFTAGPATVWTLGKKGGYLHKPTKKPANKPADRQACRLSTRLCSPPGSPARRCSCSLNLPRLRWYSSHTRRRQEGAHATLLVLWQPLGLSSRGACNPPRASARSPCTGWALARGPCLCWELRTGAPCEMHPLCLLAACHQSGQDTAAAQS